MTTNDAKPIADAGQGRSALQALLAQRDALIDALCMALPFVEDAEQDPCYKPGYARRAANDIRRVIESVDEPLRAAGNEAPGTDTTRLAATDRPQSR